MKAAVRSKYGPPEVLSIQEIEKPVPKENEVLVKVHAATVNRTDCGILWGKPSVLRMVTGLFKPRVAVMGSDFAGQIEATGKNVTAFKPGDRVMGFNGMMGCGSHAQYLVFPETKGIVSIPDNLSYEQAVTCMEGAFYAASGIRALNPKPGQKALVNGATGAIGSSLVQILKFRGVQITAVCRSMHADLVRSLGAEKIIDYETQDFTKDDGTYDFIFDTVATGSFARCKHMLTPRGVYAPSDGLSNFILALFTRIAGGKKVVFSAPTDMKSGLGFIKDMATQGHFRAVIDRKYSLDNIVEAYRYVASKQKVGNVIITMENS